MFYPGELRHLDTSAVYEDGVLKFDRPLPIKNGELIRVTLHIAPEQVQRLPNTFQWKGDPAILDKIAMDPELGVDECP